MLGDVVQRQNAKTSPARAWGVLPFSGVNPGSTPGIPIFHPQNTQDQRRRSRPLHPLVLPNGKTMKQAFARIGIGLVVFAATLAVWRASVYVDSLMTMRTPLYYQVQGWASLLMALAAGALATVWHWFE